MKTVHVKASREYDVRIGGGLLATLGANIPKNVKKITPHPPQWGLLQGLPPPLHPAVAGPLPWAASPQFLGKELHRRKGGSAAGRENTGNNEIGIGKIFTFPHLLWQSLFPCALRVRAL